MAIRRTRETGGQQGRRDAEGIPHGMWGPRLSRKGRNADGLSHRPGTGLSSWESALFLDTESEETQEAPRAGEVARQDKQGKWQP